VKPYYQDDAITLYHGTFETALAAGVLPRADAIITDPPYAETSLAWDVWPTGWPEQAATLSSVLWCFGSMRMFLDRRDDFTGWKFAQDIVWEKQNGSGLAADRFKRVHEFATHWYRGKWADLYNDAPTTQDAVARTVRRKPLPVHHQGARGASVHISHDGGPRQMRSVIRMRNMHGRAVNETQKPVELVSILLKASVPRGAL
jgi:site-specific DNA-methyltransferase (adenine-specific)